MSKKIYVNLPVKNLNKSVEFFTALGFKFNPQFTDHNATCMIVSDDIFVMLLVESFFQKFTNKNITNAFESSETIICLSADSKEEVDEYVKNALNAGGSVLRPKEDLGWMYQHGFQDLDGHLWEIAWMNMDSFPKE